MKPTDDCRLINKLITNKLIQDLFSYLSYLYQISWLFQPYYFIFISIIALSTIAFGFLLATIFYYLLALIAL